MASGSAFNMLRASSLRLASTRSAASFARSRLLSTVVLQRNQRPQIDAQWRSIRWNSSATAPFQPIPSTPPPLAESDGAFNSETLDILADAVVNIPPLQHGDLQALGLCHWTPAGLVQYSFELVHIFSGLPWFHTFVAATLLWRVAIFPFAVIGMRHTARMRPVQNELNEANMKIQEARRARDTVAMQRASVAAAKIRSEAGVSMGGLMAPMVQLPISLGMFFGIKNMCELPVMQLTQSGFSWLPDLTQPGPYFILPVLVAASGNAMILIGARDTDMSRPAIGHLMNVFRAVSVLAIYWMDHFPSGLLLSLLVTSLSSIGQTLLFRVPSVRRMLNIPQWTPPPGGSAKLPTMLESLRYYLGRSQQQGAGPSPPPSRVQHYVPPKSSTPPRTLEVIAQQAQANVSAKSSSLYEDTASSAPKTKKAGRKTKPKAS